MKLYISLHFPFMSGSWNRNQHIFRCHSVRSFSKAMPKRAGWKNFVGIKERGQWVVDKCKSRLPLFFYHHGRQGLCSFEHCLCAGFEWQVCIQRFYLVKTIIFLSRNNFFIFLLKHQYCINGCSECTRSEKQLLWRLKRWSKTLSLLATPAKLKSCSRCLSNLMITQIWIQIWTQVWILIGIQIWIQIWTQV